MADKLNLYKASEILGKVYSLSDLDRLYFEMFGRERKADLMFGEGGEQFGLDYVAKHMLEKAEQRGWLGKLLELVLKERGNRDDVQALAAAYYDGTSPIELQNDKLPRVDSHEVMSATSSGFQKVVRQDLNFEDAYQWLELYRLMLGRVCRIDAYGKHVGTGFLVGPAAVLTNYHVLEKALGYGAMTDGVDPKEISFIFDHVIDKNGKVNPGYKVRLLNPNQQNDWLLSSARYSDAEAAASSQQAILSENKPTADQLDYALVKLDRSIGADKAAHGNTRGWVCIRDLAPRTQASTVMILQYPALPDEPPSLRLAFDTAPHYTITQDGRRVRYRTNTKNGSSGSPVFDGGWSILALHHYGDPRCRPSPEWNQGVPMHLIWEKIRNEGHPQHLDGSAR